MVISVRRPVRAIRRVGVALLATVGVLVLGVVTTHAQGQTEGILQKILRTHVLTVGTISGNPPWEFVKPDGSLDGYDIAIAKRIAADLGAKVEFTQTNGAGRIPLLQTHKVDVIVAELDYSPERAQTVAYTRPYCTPGAQFMVLAAAKFQKIEDLNSPDVTLGYGLGGDEAKIWPTIVPKAKLQAFTSVADALQALASHRIDATGEPSLVNALEMKKRPGIFRVINPSYFKPFTGLAVPYGDFDWWLWLDRWVDRFNASGDNQKLWLQYMGAGTPFD
jgi:polar amino acid transport system substrate-binding protein